jgi:hypothetical protein
MPSQNHQVEQLRAAAQAGRADRAVPAAAGQVRGDVRPGRDSPGAAHWIEAIKREFDPLQQLARDRPPGRSK